LRYAQRLAKNFGEAHIHENAINIEHHRTDAARRVQEG